MEGDEYPKSFGNEDHFQIHDKYCGNQDKIDENGASDVDSIREESTRSVTDVSHNSISLWI